MAQPAPPTTDGDVVFASLPLAVIAYGATLGLPHELLIETSKIPPDDLRDPDNLVEYESLIRLWDLLLERFPDRVLGLDYASYLSPQTLGVVGYACANARDLGEALRLYARFSRLADPRLSVTIESSEGQARVALTHEPRVEAMAEPMEMMIAAVMFTSRRLNASTPPPHEVCFRHAQRHPIERYQDVFGCPVRFSAGWTGVCFPQETLALPIMGADPTVGKYLQQQVEAIERSRTPAPADDPLDARVRVVIDEGLVHGQIDQAHVARRLGLSARSLQRGLRSVGTSFSEQLDAVRRARAMDLLRQTSIPVREVAFMLGYADPRAFYRSFRRWTGQTPAEHRKQMDRPR
ncbi:MAG: AraC family transcriptional regulator [Myxococcota bacterium]